MSELCATRIGLSGGFFDDPGYLSSGYGMVPSNSQGSYSPFSGSSVSQEARIPSPGSMSQSPLHGTDYIMLNNATVIGEPFISIVEQPIDKFRFRYKSEMIGTHGSLVGASSGPNRKKQAPTVQLHNYSDKAIIRCTLVTSEDGKRIPHAHRLVRREGNEDVNDPHHAEVSVETGYTASFHGMGIIHTAKKHIKGELIRKMRNEALEKVKRRNINESLTVREETQILADAESYQKCVNLNSVSLCFQAFILDYNNIMTPITDPVYSNPINNLKSALTGELKICRIDKNTGSCEGGEEVFIFVEKVGKKNIRIKFFELNDDNEIWAAYGRFSELDVHHQYAIAFKTPAYMDLNITSPKEVFIQLERPSDLDCSEPVKFTYKPSDKIVMGRKRQRMSYSGSAELSHIMANYNVLPQDEILSTSINDSRELSKELKRLISQGCSSTELSSFAEQIDYDRYIKLLDESNENMLTSDGGTRQQHQDDVDFAKNILVEGIGYMKLNPKSGKEALRKLLKERSSYGDSAIHSALRYDQRDIAKYILMLVSANDDCSALVNEQNSSGKTPLHYAVLQNQPEMTKTLLMLGADPTKCDDHGFSPLHTVVKVPGTRTCIAILLSKENINLEAYTDSGWTALQLAAEAGSYDAVRLLVQAGASVNNTDMSHGRTALHIAVENGHKDIVQFLLEETDIDVNKTNFSGYTALHSAVVYTGSRAKELCMLLRKHGASVEIQSSAEEPESIEQAKEEVNVTVKIEQDSEEDVKEEQTSEQSSLDLTSNNPNSLWSHLNPVNDVESTAEISAKDEAIEIDSQTNWLSTDDKKNLSEILDKTKGWKKLAVRLNFDCLLRTFEQSTSSPSSLLLNYIDVQSTMSLIELENILRNLDETEAADCVMHVLSAQL